MEENKHSDLLPLSRWPHLNETQLKREIAKRLEKRKRGQATFLGFFEGGHEV